MIFGIGSDIVQIPRIEDLYLKKTDDFLNRIYGEKEILSFNAKKNDKARYAYLAKRFAAKEAFAKALGTGFRNGLQFKDIEILNDNYGKPYISLNDTAQNFLISVIGENKKITYHISLSDDYPVAQAFVIINVD